MPIKTLRSMMLLVAAAALPLAAWMFFSGLDGEEQMVWFVAAGCCALILGIPLLFILAGYFINRGSPPH